MPKLPEQLLQPGLLQPAKSWFHLPSGALVVRLLQPVDSVICRRLCREHAKGCRHFSILGLKWLHTILRLLRVCCEYSQFCDAAGHAVWLLQPVRSCCSLGAPVQLFSLGHHPSLHARPVPKWGMMAGEPKLQQNPAK